MSSKSSNCETSTKEIKNEAHQNIISFNVGQNYKLLETIGTGAYGIVCSAIDKKTSNYYFFC